MVRTVVAFESAATLNGVADMLEKNGIAVRYRCRTAPDTIRSVRIMGGGVVICGYKMGDTTAEQMCYDLGEDVSCLMLAKPVQLDLCEHEAVFKLPLPIKPSEFIGSVTMLLQLDNKRVQSRIGTRSSQDKDTIAKAKALLIRQRGMTEEQAHRYLQKRSMETSSKMAVTAKTVIAEFE